LLATRDDGRLVAFGIDLQEIDGLEAVSIERKNRHLIPGHQGPHERLQCLIGG
jgi:hypothetical protein